MKKTSKILLLLASLGMLVACGQPSGGSTPSGGGGGGGGGGNPPEVVVNQINVIYFKSYVSKARAAEIKSGYVASLEAAGIEVDASKVNFFESNNSKVAGFVDEILDYNEENPSNQISVILGANGFDNADEPNKTTFLAKYQNDGDDYTYGTHSNDSNNKNRKFWYDKDKLTDPFVLGLQTYLKLNWMDGGGEPPEITGKLTVAIYGSYVSSDKKQEIEDGFSSYLFANNITIGELDYVYDSESSNVEGFMGVVAEYDEANPENTVDVLLGLATPSGFSNNYPGWSNDGVKYNYGTKSGSEDNRRFWYKSMTEEVKAFQAYMQANYVPVVDEYYLMSDATEWTTDVAALADYKMTKVTDNQYKYENLEVGESGFQFKVYHPQGTDDATKYYSNDSTWEDCGFTLSDPDKNVVLAEGKYNINFFVAGENNNHVTVEKQSEGGDEDPAFKVAFFNKYISSENIAAIKDGINAAFTAASITTEIKYQELTEEAGATSVSKAMELVENGTQVLLGFRGNVGNSDYEVLGTTEYLYGIPTEQARKLWVLSSAKETAEVTAVYNYLEANWAPVFYDLYLIGSMNNWSTDIADLADYKLEKVDENHYHYAGLEVGEAGLQFKVYYPDGATNDDKYISNDSTWDNCGFTLSDPDKNIVIEKGKYNVDFYVVADNNNHITVEKESTEFHIAFFERYISADNIAALKDGIQAAFTAAGITKELVFEQGGKGSKAKVADLLNDISVGVEAILGANGDGEGNPLATAGYEQYDGTSYSYGTDAKRKLWVLKTAKSSVEVTTLVAYLAANWSVEA